MAFDDTDRRRFSLVMVFTLIAVPAFWLYSRTTSDGEVDTSAPPAADSNVINPESGGGAPAPDGAAPTSNRTARPPLEAPQGEPIFMDGPIADENPAIPEIAVPAQPAIEPMMFTASFRSSIPGVRTCLAKGLQTGQTVTVMNLDNSRTTTCVVQIAPATQQEDIVLHTETFEQIADLTDAPIFVEVRQ